jgi:hypothetical protein
MTLYIYEFALGEELLRSFCEWTPCYTIGILSIRERFSGWAFVVSIGSDGEGGDFFVGSSSSGKWILGNITNEDNLVDCTHRTEIRDSRLEILN